MDLNLKTFNYTMKLCQKFKSVAARLVRCWMSFPLLYFVCSQEKLLGIFILV